MLVAQSGKIKVPSGREAQELWNAFQTYLKDQQRIVTGDFQELVAIKIGQTVIKKNEVRDDALDFFYPAHAIECRSDL